MELSPGALREARFTERFRGYDAAEVDAFLDEAAGALEELVAEASAPMAALAAERARDAIEEVRRGSLEAMEGLHRERHELEAAVAALRRTLEERRREVVEVLALIDAALAETPAVTETGTGGEGDADAGGGRSAPEAAGQDAGDGDGDDTFLARLEEAAAGGTAPDAC